MVADAQDRAALLTGIYAIAEDAAVARAALRAGVRIVQYRAKETFDPAHAHEIRAAAREYGALFILNDRWREIETYDADGVHVGPDDVPFSDLPRVRAAIGTRLLGVSAGTVEEALLASAARADYLGTGSVHATASKADAGAPIGLDGLRAVVRATALPVAAIGGITLADIPGVRASGAAMAAVISAISGASEPYAAAAALVKAWNGC
ncbi:MAG TPA: thiamine phosphate synthase [Candidatus Baltobacteraceae bacterium]|nr:thiamine phosphate synthase [Candidatus Baltobacteraceae bacterium]